MDIGMLISSSSTLAAVALKAVGIYLSVIVLTRIYGLRSFSKISSYDFAMTVAIGSVVATAILSANVSLLQGIVALIAIYVLKSAVGHLRTRDWLGRAVDNPPLLILRNGELLEDNLQAADMSIDDLRAKLREANVLELEQARAVVFESTGDVSVLHADDADAPVDTWLLKGVRTSP